MPRSPEGPPSEEGLIKRERGELIVPKVEFGDLVVVHDVRERLLPAVRENIRETVDNDFAEELKKFLDNARQVRRRGLFGKQHYVDRKAIIEGQELFERLEEERSQLPVMRTLRELRQIAVNTLEAAERTHKENRVFLRYFFPTPITESEAKDVWEAVLPREDITEVLGGLLFSSKRTVPFHAHGKRHQTAESEDVKLIGPFLPEEMLDELVEKIRLPATELNQSLKKTIELVSSLGAPGLEEEPELEEEELGDEDHLEHLEFAVRVFNYALAQIAENPSHPKAGIFGILMGTALTKIKRQLERDIGSETDHWYESKLIPTIKHILRTPHGSFLKFLKSQGYSEKRPFEYGESGKYYPPYATKRIKS